MPICQRNYFVIVDLLVRQEMGSSYDYAELYIQIQSQIRQYG